MLRTYLILTAVLLMLCGASIAPAQDSVRDTDRIDRIMHDAMAGGLISGGVVLVGTDSGTLFSRGYGQVSPGDARPMAVDTVFDVASLTKVLVTAPSVMRLAEEGELSLVDPLVRWFPEFAGSDKDGLLVMHLLTHTSGLDDVPFSRAAAMPAVVSAAAAQQLKGEPGSRFRYADINFMLLGELVRRVSGIGLDRFAERYIFTPLGMLDTAFTPPQHLVVRSAATLDDGGRPQFGLVQDANSRALGGVAGHAGLFSSAPDLGRFCAMVLNGGAAGNGVRVLSRRTLEQMTAPYFSRGGKVVRGLGWDIASPFSSPRGNAFSEMSFGHTGYSGSSVWIDPESKLYVILLTTRLSYKNISDFSRLRSDISTAAAGIFITPEHLAHVGLY